MTGDDEQFGPEDIAVPEQLEVLCYINTAGNVVIRQTDWPEENDCLIVVRPENALRLAQAIVRVAGVEVQLVAVERLALPAPAPARPSPRMAATNSELPLGHAR